MSNDIEYKSQFGQDKWLIENVFKGKTSGYFIDCGAGDPFNGSNTYTLEKFFDWSGVAIDINMGNNRFWLNGKDEPKPTRSCSVVRALLSHEAGLWENIVPGGGTTGVLNDSSNKYIKGNIDKNGAFLMPTHTLTQVLDAINAPLDIDFFSLDVEGHELNVLQGLDTTKYTINTLCIEYHRVHQHNPALETWLNKEGYTDLKAKISSDTIWQKI